MNNIIYKITALLLAGILPLALNAQIERTTIPVRASPTVIKADPKYTEQIKVRDMTEFKRVTPERVGSNPGNTSNPGSSGNTGTTPPVNLEELERQGPSNKPFNVANLVQSDVDFTGDKVLNVYNTIFRDANMKSGYYYYLPASYSLTWSATTSSYDFQVTYGAAGRVTVTAILRPKLSKNDLDMARDILSQNIKGKPEQGFGIKEFIAIPMSEAPELEFTKLSQFGVSTENVSLRPPSDLTDPIYISFPTDLIDELMAMFFNNVGLYGDVLVHPDGEGMPSTIRIPFNLKIDSPDTYGKFEMQASSWRANPWRNTTDYPVVLTNFHVLKRENTGIYKVYTWKTGDVETPNGAMVNFDANSVPAWIDTDPSIKRIWMDYAIKSCSNCNVVVKKKIVGTIQDYEAARPEKLEFTILTPMSFTKASLMKISIRSFQATPEGNSKIELPSLTVSQDGAVLDGGTLYVKGGKWILNIK
ncbi:MAG: hypothetical protein IPL65_11065 [Lewinellaceae bacterium]|nr:hypothetical protein [Lewinellaceae bacterium]